MKLMCSGHILGAANISWQANAGSDKRSGKNFDSPVAHIMNATDGCVRINIERTLLYASGEIS